MTTKEDLVSRFTWIDYCVFGLMLLSSAAIGIYHGFIKKTKGTQEEFLMAGRSMPAFPVALSLIASFMSAITLLGTGSEVYVNGFSYWLLLFSYIFVFFATVYVYLPVFWELQVTSAYEYLERRFNSIARKMGSIIFIIHMCTYMAIVVYAPSLALSQVTGIHVYVSVCAICIVVMFYTTIGGMKAVLWTDTLQVFIMYGVMVFIVVKGMVDEGGFSAVWETSARGNRTELINLDLNPTTRHTLWSLVIGGFFTWTAIYAVNQAQVQRYLCVRRQTDAVKAMAINIIGITILLLVCAFSGLVLYKRYETCDPIKLGLVSKPDQLLPLYVMETLGTWKGLPGLFVAGIFSGALSTVSSGINSLAAITLEDFIKSCYPNLSERRATIISKFLSFLYGLITLGLVFVAEKLGNVLRAALAIHGMIGGPLLGIFTLGMLFPWSNSIGAIVGTVAGFVLAFWIGVGYNIKVIMGEYTPRTLPLNTYGCNTTFLEPDIITNEAEGDILWIYKISYMWYSAVGCITAIVVGMIVSALTGFNDLEKIDPILLSPVVHKLKRFLPGGSKIKDIHRPVNDEETANRLLNKNEHELK